MVDDNETHHRDQRKQAVYDRALVVAKRQYPALTDSQHRALAVAIQNHSAFETFTNEGVFDPGDDWIASEYNMAVEHFHPQMFRAVPDVQTLTMALVAMLPANRSSQDEMTLARRVERMSADERLAASEGLDLKAAPKAQTPPDTRTPEQRAQGFTAEDLELQRRGFAVNDLDPLKRQAMRREIAKERAPTPTPSIDKARLIRSLGREPTDITMMAASREAAAIGKPLEELLK
jgi:hypothetical protein